MMAITKHVGSFIVIGGPPYFYNKVQNVYEQAQFFINNMTVSQRHFIWWHHYRIHDFNYKFTSDAYIL